MKTISCLIMHDAIKTYCGLGTTWKLVVGFMPRPLFAMYFIMEPYSWPISIYNAFGYY